MANSDKPQDETKEQRDALVAADNGDPWNDYDDPIDLYGAPFEGHGTYEDYEPNPYDGTYSEMQGVDFSRKKYTI